MKHFYTRSKAAFFILLVALSLPLTTHAQAPDIAYSGVAASYPPNAAISALTPTNSGGAVVGTYGAVITLAGSGQGSGATNLPVFFQTVKALPQLLIVLLVLP